MCAGLFDDIPITTVCTVAHCIRSIVRKTPTMSFLDSDTATPATIETL